MDKTIHNKGLTRKEYILLKPLVKAPWEKFTLAEIKKAANKKSHHYVFEALKKFTALGIIREIKKGNTNIYSLNPENEGSAEHLAFVELLIKEETKDIPYNNLAKITGIIKSPFYILVVTGSYAEQKQKLTSDIDIAVIIPDSEPKHTYETAIKQGELMVPEVHGFVFTEKEFIMMLENNEFNYGKEITKKHVIITGGEAYYKILFKAVKHGYQG